MCYHIGHITCLVTLDFLNSDSKATENSEKSGIPWKVTCPPNLQSPVWTVLGWGAAETKSLFIPKLKDAMPLPSARHQESKEKVSTSQVYMPVTSAFRGWESTSNPSSA